MKVKRYYKLSEMLDREGQWLFRFRSYLPLVLIIFAIVSMWTNRSIYVRNCIRYEVFCLLISLVGETIRFISVGYAADSTSGRNTKKQVAAELNKTGIYSIVRNPLYLGNFLMWLGVTLLTKVLWLVLVLIFVFWLYYERIIYSEELFLSEKFGAEYDEYTQKTPCFIPDFTNYIPNKYYFRMKKAIRQELSSIYGMFATFCGLILLRNYFRTKQIFLHDLWLYVIILSTVGYLVLLYLKKETKIFKNDPMRKRDSISE